MRRQPTPLDMLMAEQRRVRESCRVQEQKINADFKFIHDHSGRILFAGISSLFFSKRRENGKNDGGEEAEGQIPMLGMMFKNISPLLWEAALPILLRWGLGRVGNLFKKRPKR